MYLDGRWYSLTAREGTYDDSDPIGVLDVTVLSERVLDRLLGIKVLRTDKRIDFVGGIRGLGELQRRVDSGEMKVAFALYPVSMKQLIDIADSARSCLRRPLGSSRNYARGWSFTRSIDVAKVLKRIAL